MQSLLEKAQLIAGVHARARAHARPKECSDARTRTDARAHIHKLHASTCTLVCAHAHAQGHALARTRPHTHTYPCAFEQNMNLLCVRCIADTTRANPTLTRTHAEEQDDEGAKATLLTRLTRHISENKRLAGALRKASLQVLARACARACARARVHACVRAGRPRGSGGGLRERERERERERKTDREREREKQRETERDGERSDGERSLGNNVRLLKRLCLHAGATGVREGRCCPQGGAAGRDVR